MSPPSSLMRLVAHLQAQSHSILEVICGGPANPSGCGVMSAVIQHFYHCHCNRNYFMFGVHCMESVACAIPSHLAQPRGEITHRAHHDIASTHQF